MQTRKSFSILSLNLIMMFLLSSHLQAQIIKGDWWGYMNGIRVVMTFDSTENGYQLKFNSPEEDRPATVSNFTFIYPDIKYTLFDYLHYEGKIDSKYRNITGIMKSKSDTVGIKIIFSRDSIPITYTYAPPGYSKQEVSIPMRDGVKLFTSVYTPLDSSKLHPILLTRTPYGERFPYQDRFLKENYIMVFQDVRGKYMSEGKYEDIRPYIANKKSNQDIDEASDTYDGVDWLVKNVKNNNGKVGVMGVSYPGFYATMAILSHHPAIKAVSPQAPVTNWFLGDDFHHNGAFFLSDPFDFYYWFGRIYKTPGRKGFPHFNYPVNDNYQFFSELGPIKNIPSKYFGDTVKFWNEIISHPNYDAFWKARDPQQFLKNVGPAVMTVGGWFDAEDLYGALHTYQTIEKQNLASHPNYLVMGPWAHGQWQGKTAERLGNIFWGVNTNKAFQEEEVKFFNYYLKNEGRNDQPEASIFVTGANEWRSFEKWPPANVVSQKIFLLPSGKLAFSAPDLKESFDEYSSDPLKPVPYSEIISSIRTTEYMTADQRFASRRPDVMVYQTDTLKEGITLAGPLLADLFVSTTGTDADYVVKLIDVFPQNSKAPEVTDLKIEMGGYQMLVRGEVFRGKYRNSFEKPEPFKPGQVTEVKYELQDVAHMFKKGHRIMIQVQNSWFPLVDSNPQKFVDIYHCSETDFQKATHRIYHDQKHASSLEIKVLK